MKRKIFNLALFMALGLSVTLFYGCSGSESQDSNSKEQVDEGSHDHSDGDHDHDHADGNHDHGDHDNGTEADKSTSKYVCPMFCEGSESEEAGQCPVCGMDIVLRADLN